MWLSSNALNYINVSQVYGFYFYGASLLFSAFCSHSTKTNIRSIKSFSYTLFQRSSNVIYKSRACSVFMTFSQITSNRCKYPRKRLPLRITRTPELKMSRCVFGLLQTAIEIGPMQCSHYIKYENAYLLMTYHITVKIHEMIWFLLCFAKNILTNYLIVKSRAMTFSDIFWRELLFWQINWYLELTAIFWRGFFL